MAQPLVLTGIVRLRGPTKNRTVSGSRIDASLTRVVKIGPGAADIVEVPSIGTGVVDAEGAFQFEIPGEGDPKDPIALTVSSPDGILRETKQFTLEQASHPLTFRIEGSPSLLITPSDDPNHGSRVSLTGRVIDAKGRDVAAGLPVVLWGTTADEAASIPPHPLLISKTQSGGFFSADWIATPLKEAFGKVAGSAAIPIRLDDALRLPRRVLLVLDVPNSDGGTSDNPPAIPNPSDLTANPAAFSQDLGRGCVDLTTPNRSIEEFTYNFVVRTSEPEVKGLTLGVRRIVPKALLADLVEASTQHAIVYGRTVRDDDVDDLKELSLDLNAAQRLVAGDDPPTLSEIKRAAWLSEVGWLKDLTAGVVGALPTRQPLDADHAIDWDDTPTIYQAISIARGHILEFREIWRPDGFSLGDLLQSLPLAPGQRRQVAIVDWERRTTTIRDEALEYEEQLQAFVARDRDISEIVGSRLSEETSAASSNTTWGVAGGIGAGFIGAGFGIFGGVAGSSGGSTSTAWQDSSRKVAGDSLQSLRDRVVQRSSSVRDERSTIVQTAAQGETQRAETETLANYNHCHAMTVEYFEVLRHFVITHELSDVRECLFVPLPMSEFDAGKALRWQTPLIAYLQDRSLLPAFDAIRRIADNWEGWDYPVSRYSEEAPEVLQGELRISFILPRPRDAADGAFQIDMWKPWQSWLWTDPFELWTAQVQAGIAEYNADVIATRDKQYREKIAPEIAKRIMDRLRFAYVTTAGGETEVSLDATLVSRYQEGVPLYVTLRPSGALAPTPREEISQFKIYLDSAELPPDAQVIVHTGKMRYQTEHKHWVLFDDDRILNDLGNTDAVYISTPTSWAETRNPRQEDLDLRDRLVAHLNRSLEYYHQVIWIWLDAERRFMLLDGILVPGLGGKSVASIVENRLIGIAGNSLILPLAPGIQIDPRVNSESEGNLRDLYAVDSPVPVRVSVPTRGVYAEAIMGDCDACEEIDDSRYWRWTTAGMLNPPEIEAVSTGSRAEAEESLKETPLPKPLVAIQNAPDLPVPVGLGEVFKLLSRPDLFPDITGLEGTQKNARAAFDAALSAASGMASEATKVARQQITASNGERLLDRINRAQQDGLLTPGAAQELSTKVLGTMTGTPDEKSDKKADSPVADPAVQKAIDKTSQADKGAVKVSTADETIEMSFEGGDTKLGSGAFPVGNLDVDDHWVDQHVITETRSGSGPGSLTLLTKDIAKLDDLKVAFSARVAKIDGKFLRPHPMIAKAYQLFSRLRIAYPADAKDAKKVAGSNRLPLVVLVHGQHESYEVSEVRNHDGYAFLQDYLAKQGLVSVSVDTNGANFFDSLIEMRAQLVLEAIDYMRRQDNDAKSPFHNRLDFDKVGLMGHSRGGDAVTRAAELNTTNRRCVVRAVAAVAPTDFTGMLVAAAQRKPDAAAAGFFFVLYGGLDGDVSGSNGARTFTGTGFRAYDRATAPKAMVYLPGCIHNRFNRTWSSDDSGLLPTDVARVHSRPDHEQLLIDYVGGLFEWKLLGTSARAAVFNSRFGNSLGHEASLQWSWGKRIKILDDFEGSAGAGGPRTVHSADVAAFADVVVAGLKLEPNTSHQTTVLAIEAGIASPPPVALELEFNAGQRDWSGYEWLTFRLGTWMEVTDAGTIAAGVSPPPLTITVVDGAGATKTITQVSFTGPLIPGKPVFHKVNTPGGVVNASLHRLATCSIAVSGFSGIKLNDVRKLRIIPPPTFAQRIFIDSLSLVTE